MIRTSYCSKTTLTIFLTFKTVYRAQKSVKEPSIVENIQFYIFVELHGLR